MEEGVHLGGGGLIFVDEPPVEECEKGAGAGVGESGAASGAQVTRGGHGSEALVNGASEMASTEFHDIASFLRSVHRGHEWPHVGYVFEEFSNGSDTVGSVAMSSEGVGEHLEEVFDVAEEEIVLIGVVSVKSGTADFGAIEDVLDGDGFERLLLHECDESVAEAVACGANAAVDFFRGGFRDRFLFSAGDDDFQFGGKLGW